mgnify:FL=1
MCSPTVILKFAAVSFALVTLVTGQPVTPDDRTGEPSWNLLDVAPAEDFVEAWKVGGWLGQESPFEVELNATGAGTLKMNYAGGGNHKYFQLYRQGEWDLTRFTHFRFRVKADAYNYRTVLILKDSSGRWSGVKSAAWITGKPRTWQRFQRGIVAPRFPRKGPKADLSDIVYIALQIKPPPDSLSRGGVIEVDDLAFYNANIIPNPGFERGGENPQGWQLNALASVSREHKYEGARSVNLERKQGDAGFPRVTSERFAVRGGMWKFEARIKGEHQVSPDPSYNTAVHIETVDSEGQPLRREELGTLSGKTPWRLLRRRWRAPQAARGARIVLSMNKTYGRSWVDALSLTRVRRRISEKDAEPVTFSFDTTASGNLFLPGMAVDVTVTAHASKPLDDAERNGRWEIRDYWGARHGGQHALEMKTASGADARYRADISVDPASLETGVYYELHVRLPNDASSSTSFAILPEAAANQFPPQRIPFGTQGWTWRNREAQKIAARLGCRWSRGFIAWDTAEDGAPVRWDKFDEKWKRTRLDNFRDFGLRPYYTIKAGKKWERGSTDYTLEQLHAGAEEVARRYRSAGATAFKLGNEPPGWDYETVKRSVKGYKALHKGFKAGNPTCLTISTSINNNHEAFLKAGTGHHCDVIDFHAYIDLDGQRRLTRNMIHWMEKYGERKPLWCTEMGTKGLGLSRRRRAIDCLAKQIVFLADGGSRVDWFALQGFARYENTYKGAFGVYNPDGSPRFDAVSYYHLINLLTVKEFVAEASWKDGNKGFLFSDNQDNHLLALWNRARADDAFVPLPGIGTVALTYLDGHRVRLDAAGEGITVRLGEEPVLMTFRGSMSGLPDSLGTGHAGFNADGHAPFVTGNRNELTLTLAEEQVAAVKLAGPPQWSIQPEKGSPGQSAQAFAIPIPEESAVRTARLDAILHDRKLRARGHLYLSRPVRGSITVRLLPGPAPGRIRLRLTNRGSEKRRVSWRVRVAAEAPMQAGTYDFHAASESQASIEQEPSGTSVLPPGGDVVKTFSTSPVNRTTLYRIRADLRAENEHIASAERWMGGFIGLPFAETRPDIDGALDDGIWRRAPRLHLNERRQYTSKEDRPWKGPADLSGTLRLAWDREHLYIAVKSTDDIFRNAMKENRIWAGDGLQFLLDPYRATDSTEGLYDYAAAHGAAGDQVWRFRSAHSAVPGGAAADVAFVSTPTPGSAGRIYEIAIPWTSIRPFKPEPGANLGFSLIINEDDGSGRFQWIGWFSGVSQKKVAQVGDLVLAK